MNEQEALTAALREWIAERRTAHGAHAGDERFAGGYVACLDDLERDLPSLGRAHG